ncbi:MAG: DUF3108 domain-containing protein [Desulfobacterales bacterium]|jgi:hypothetical protein
MLPILFSTLKTGLRVGIILVLILMPACSSVGSTENLPFIPGEKLTFQLRWENIPAGHAVFEVRPVKEHNGEQVHHFVLTASTNSTIDVFYKVRDRFESYTDLEMRNSLMFKKKQREGSYKKDALAEFDWTNSQVNYTLRGEQKAPLVGIPPGAFDPLSAFYFIRMMELKTGSSMERPITDGSKKFMGRIKVVGREMLTLESGTYDTFVVEPETTHIGGVFQKSKDPKLRFWITADERRIPVRIKSKVVVGHFIVDLVAVEGI